MTYLDKLKRCEFEFPHPMNSLNNLVSAFINDSSKKSIMVCFSKYIWEKFREEIITKIYACNLGVEINEVFEYAPQEGSHPTISVNRIDGVAPSLVKYEDLSDKEIAHIEKAVDDFLIKERKVTFIK